MEKDNLNKIVVEIRCPCQRGFSIRSDRAKKTNLCNKCLRLYIVRQYSSRSVTVHFIAPGNFSEEQFDKSHWSLVTSGE